MRRTARIEKSARQLTNAQALLGEALVRVAGASNDRIDTVMAAHYVDSAIEAAKRARRGLELLRDEQLRELRALDEALRQ